MPSEATFVLLVCPDPADPARYRAWCPDVPDWYATGYTADEAADRGAEIVRALVSERWHSDTDRFLAPTTAVPVTVRRRSERGPDGGVPDGGGPDERARSAGDGPAGGDGISEESEISDGNDGVVQAPGQAPAERDERRRGQEDEVVGMPLQQRRRPIEAGSSRRWEKDAFADEGEQTGYSTREVSFGDSAVVSFNNPFDLDEPDV